MYIDLKVHRVFVLGVRQAIVACGALQITFKFFCHVGHVVSNIKYRKNRVKKHGKYITFGDCIDLYAISCLFSLKQISRR